MSCFRDKIPGVGGVILAREGEIEDDSSFLVWVTGWVMLFIKIGRQEEEQVWVGKVMSSLLGQLGEVPKGISGDTQ